MLEGGSGQLPQGSGEDLGPSDISWVFENKEKSMSGKQDL